MAARRAATVGTALACETVWRAHGQLSTLKEPYQPSIKGAVYVRSGIDSRSESCILPGL